MTHNKKRQHILWGK